MKPHAGPGLAAAAPAAAPTFGLYGGAFDPPHLGHVALAQAAVRQLRLQQLFVMPTGDAWHKPRHLTPAIHRLAMAERAFGPLDRVTVRRDEVDRSGPSYTVDTLAALQQAGPPHARWLVLMGEDQWRRITTWSRWAQLMEMATIVVAERPDAACASGHFFNESDPRVGPPHTGPLRLQAPQLPFSSTAIRQVLAGRHQDPSWAQTAQALGLPPAVARYISHHPLYLNPPESPTDERIQAP